MLYTSPKKDGELVGIYDHLSKAPVFSSSRMNISRLAVATAQLLVFRDATALVAAGLSEEALRKWATARSREIGAAVRFLDCDGLIVPNARWRCRILMLFLDRLGGRDASALKETHGINWSAWRERSARR